MVLFIYDEYAKGAPQFYGDVMDACEAEEPGRAKASAEAAVSKKREVASLLALATVHLHLDEAPVAKPLAEEALNLAKRAQDRRGEAAALHMLAKVHSKDQNAEEAEAVANQALELYKSSSDRLGEASVLNTKAGSAAAWSEELLDWANAALDIFKQASETSGTAAVLHTILTTKLWEGNYPHAISVADELVRLFRGKQDLLREGAAQQLAAEVHAATGDLQEAVVRANAAVELFGKAKDFPKKAAAVNQVANALQRAGMYEEATKAANASLQLCRESKDKRGQAAAYCMMATIQDSQRNFGRAAFKMEKAANIYKQLNDKREEAQTLESVASAQLKAYQTLDDPNWPVQNAERAVSLYEELGMKHSSECAYCLQTLAFALLAKEDGQSALAKARESITCFQHLGSASGEASAYSVLAQVLWQLDVKQEAEAAAAKAVQLAKEAGDEEEERFAKELHEEYSGAKKSDTAVDSGGFTTATGETIRTAWIGMYSHGGKNHAIVDGFTTRGTSAQTAKKKSSSVSAAQEDFYAEQAQAKSEKKMPTLAVDFRTLAKGS